MRDRWLRPRYVFAALALLVLIAALFTRPAEEGANVARLTTFGTDPAAARGIYEVIGRLGWPVARRRSVFRAPLDSATIYVILAPVLEPSATEVGALLDAVRRGARLVVSPGPGTPLADSLGLQGSPFSTFDLDVVPSARGVAPAVERAAKGVGSFRHVLEPVRRSAADTAPVFPAGTLTLVQVRRGDAPRDPISPTIMARRIGRGVVLAIADPHFLRNRVVRRGPAAVLAVRLLEWLDPSGRTPVVFDEYHQGFGTRDQLVAVVGRAVVRTAPGRGLLHLVVAGIVLLLAIGVRPIAPRPRTRIARRSPLEHVGALSRAYEQIEATRLATARLVRGLRRRHPLGVHAEDDDQYLAVLGARQPALAADVELLRTALRRPLPATEWVAVGGAIHHIERTLSP